MKSSILISLAAAVFFSGAALAGQTFTQERHVTVALNDLDLNSETGVAVLFERLRVATDTVCAPVPSATSTRAATRS